MFPVMTWSEKVGRTFIEALDFLNGAVDVLGSGRCGKENDNVMITGF